MAIVATTNEIHADRPAAAITNGMIIAGAAVGAILESDWARVSHCDRMSGRRP